MSINTLPYNPTILSEIKKNASSLSGFVLQQAVAQSGTNIDIDSVVINVVSGKDYLVQVSFSATGSTPNSALSLILEYSFTTPQFIQMGSSNYNEIYTATFKYTAISTGSITLSIYANTLQAQRVLITTVNDFVNVVIYTL